ncbi:MAG: 3-deoxy-manno-octulosonate cytidylyltransferase [Pseudarcicella sp.]|nr:3-deoxy-manno-octulosonate cytidylyltransferase [Pseudarcicella sp.]MBP6410437.1 3-deoxy-manno-octulosonate cytidylyltransferase [Pseudarcicella sp.]
MKILGIIPARLASTRFPEKALADIMGKSMIRRTYDKCLQASSLDSLVVATDDEKIYKHVKDFGGNVVMTSVDHLSGTDRCNEAYENYGDNFDFVINIQGDEPFIQPQQIDILANVLTPETQIATLVKKISDQETLFNTNTPKVVFDLNKQAKYFSRHPVPFQRGVSESDWLKGFDYFKHIGIYAYRVDILKEITQLPASTLELAECLEQLRWLENGYTILVENTLFDSFGIDEPSDVQKAIQKFMC